MLIGFIAGSVVTYLFCWWRVGVATERAQIMVNREIESLQAEIERLKNNI